ncbi:Dioxygenase [Rubellimicrobium mesophilum DSM 19309]|uniref:Dioxygenase n=2 Tax=Rubellimicrobium TaxID=295418 RepID=A0A017HRR8_9RHOB|nr:Dioxygenase [Rubellimicrobium mesophilum DSM 19309]
MFLTSGPDLVVEACRSGIVGSFPALNQRSTEGFVAWLDEIEGRLAGVPGVAPFGVNLIVHKSNPRLRADLDVVIARRVPLVITSLGAVSEIVAEVHSYGGLVFHDVISRRHAEKAAAAGVDGIIAVAAGAGGHGGTLSPFAMIEEIRQVFAGTIILAGAIGRGSHVLAARAAGADMVSIGTRFLATREALVPQAQKDMVREALAGDIVHTPAISGVAANFLRRSLVQNGLDPDALPSRGRLDMADEVRIWKTVWSAGQGVGSIDDIPGTAELCQRLAAEYRDAMERLLRDPFDDGRGGAQP